MTNVLYKRVYIYRYCYIKLIVQLFVIPPNPRQDEQTDVLKKYIVQYIVLYVISGRTFSGINKSVGKCCGWCGISSLASLSLRQWQC